MQELILVNQKEASSVLSRIDHLIKKIHDAVEEADSGFMNLAFLLLQAKNGAFWTTRGFKSEHEYINSVFPQSRSQYYRLIKIGRDLVGYNRNQLEALGSSKCEDLSRVHRHSGKVEDSWFKHAAIDDKDTFRRRVRDYMNKESPTKDKKQPGIEDHFITFRIFGDGINTVNTALETMAVLAGSDKGLGYLLELLCANFNSQSADDGTGHVSGKNSFILTTIKGLVEQLDLSNPETSEMLIGIIAAGIDKNTGTE